MLFCNYIDEDDIEVLFFECNAAGLTVWQSFANLKPPFGEVHKRVGMSFMAPAYRDITITDVVKCYMQLRRISDREASDPIIFYYLPLNPQHNCPFAEFYSTSRLSQTSGVCRKKSKSDNQFFNVSDDLKADPFKPFIDTTMKFEDIDSDIEVIQSERDCVQKDMHLSEALPIKSETIESK